MRPHALPLCTQKKAKSPSLEALRLRTGVAAVVMTAAATEARAETEAGARPDSADGPAVAAAAVGAVVAAVAVVWGKDVLPNERGSGAKLSLDWRLR